MRPGGPAVGVRHHDADRREQVRGEHAEGDVRQPGRPQVLELARGGHAHFQQEEAEYALEQRHEEAVVGAGDFGALQAADQADEDAAEEQVQAGIQEDLVEQFPRDDALLLRPGSAVAVVVGVFHLLEGHLELGLHSRFVGRFRMVAGLADVIDQRECLRIVPRLIRHVAQGVHPLAAKPGHEEEGHEAAGDLHHGQHDRHVRLVGDVRRGQYPQRRHEGSRRIRPVIAGDGRLVDPPHPRRGAKDGVGEDADHRVRQEADDHEPGDRPDVVGIEVRELLAAVPADRDQEVDRERLVHHVRELKVDPQDRDQEPEVEEEQERLEQVVPEVVPELREHGFLLLGLRRAGVVHRDP